MTYNDNDVYSIRSIAVDALHDNASDETVGRAMKVIQDASSPHDSFVNDNHGIINALRVTVFDTLQAHHVVAYMKTLQKLNDAISLDERNFDDEKRRIIIGNYEYVTVPIDDWVLVEKDIYIMHVLTDAIAKGDFSEYDDEGKCVTFTHAMGAICFDETQLKKSYYRVVEINKISHVAELKKALQADEADARDDVKGDAPLKGDARFDELKLTNYAGEDQTYLKNAFDILLIRTKDARTINVITSIINANDDVHRVVDESRDKVIARDDAIDEHAINGFLKWLAKYDESVPANVDDDDDAIGDDDDERDDDALQKYDAIKAMYHIEHFADEHIIYVMIDAMKKSFDKFDDDENVMQRINAACDNARVIFEETILKK